MQSRRHRLTFHKIGLRKMDLGGGRTQTTRCIVIMLLWLLLPSSAVHSWPQTETTDMIAPNTIRALYKIIQQHFVPNTRECIISLHAKQRHVRRTMDRLLTLLLPHLYMIKVDIKTVEGEWSPSRRRMFNLLLIDELRALEELDPAAVTANYDINEYYLVVLIQPHDALDPVALISDVLHYFWRHYLINISLLYEKTPERADFFTYYPFVDERSCKRNSVRHINSYSNSTWHRPPHSHIFPNKLDNLHKCSLKVAVWDTPPYLSYNPNASGTGDVIGDFEGEMLLVLAEKLNFSMEFVEPPNNEQRGQRFPNGTLTGALKMVETSKLTERTADLSLGCFRYTLERTEVLTGALPYYQTWQIFGVLLTSRPYNSLEILAFAFDNNVWLCLCASLQVVLVLAYVVYRRSWHSQLARIVMGYPRPTTPLTNILGSFLGISVQSVPKTNFARFVFVLWFIYGYLMRIAYQSLLFQLMQTDLYRPPPKQLHELVQLGYTLIMSTGTNSTMHSVPQIAQGLIRVMLTNNGSELHPYELVERANGKYAGVSPQDFLTYYVMRMNRRGVFYILPEKIFTQHNTLYFTKHSFLIERFNELLMNLRGHGLIDYWASKRLDMRYFERSSSNEIALEALDLTDTLGIFFIYLVLIFVCIVVFALEWIWNKMHASRTFIQ